MQPFDKAYVAWASRSFFGALFLVTLGFAAQLVAEDSEPWMAALNVAIMALPLALFFFALGLLAEVVEQELMTHHLTRPIGAILRWTPRIGILLFAAFVSLFALDIFGQGYSFWETVVGLFMHLIPTWILLAVLVVAWRWPLVGGAAMLAAAGALLFVVRWSGDWHSDWLLT